MGLDEGGMAGEAATHPPSHDAVTKIAICTSRVINLFGMDAAAEITLLRGMKTQRVS